MKHSTMHYSLILNIIRYGKKTGEKATLDKLETLAQQHTLVNWSRLINQYTLQITGEDMSKTRRDYNMQFVNINLSSAQVRELKEFINSGEYDLGEILQEILFSQCRITLTHKLDDGKCFATIMTAKDAVNIPNIGFSSFARDPLESVLSAYYKFKVLLDLDIANALDYGQDNEIG